MPYILHLDTSGPVGIAMLAKDGKPLASRSSNGERDHAGSINRLVDEVVAEGGISLSRIDAVAVCNGPGSYTGLRIGLATAKGYCYVLGKPLILHNRLILMLREAMLTHPAKNTAAIIPARSGEYYAAAAGPSINFVPAHILTAHLLRDMQQINNGLCIIGTAGADLLPLIELKGYKLIAHHILDEHSWAGTAVEAFASGNFAAIAYAEPEYLKPAFITARRPDR